MIFDGLTVFFVISLAVAGWNIGLAGCWTVPLSMVAATVATQAVYVDFSTWLVQQLKMEPGCAVFLGYLLVWLCIEAACELILAMLPRQSANRQLLVSEKCAGAAVGLIKGLTILVFASMASATVHEIPDPPGYEAGSAWIGENLKTSRLLHVSHRTAYKLKRSVGKYVVSGKGPSFQPDFDSSEKITVSAEQEKQVKKLIEALRAYRDLSAESN